MAPTILVVDDEPTIVEIVSLYLAREGYRVLSAADGESAKTRRERRTRKDQQTRTAQSTKAVPNVLRVLRSLRVFAFSMPEGLET